MEKAKCHFCGREIDAENERVISGDFYEDISEGFAEGRQQLKDLILCAECFEKDILGKLKED